MLGHARAELVAALNDQSAHAWLLSGMPHPAQERMQESLAPLIPPGMQWGMQASTGMEAAEQAIRIAKVHTGRPGAVGFAKAMHGKSIATAYLAWDNADGIELRGWSRLPFVDQRSEDAILSELLERLRTGEVGAVFLELMQGSNGAHEASTAFYKEAEALIRQAGALLVVDEILSGLFRTGPRYRFEHHGLAPDMVLVGKALGNGFPVAGVMTRQGIAIQPAMLPGSTFAGNPLACSVVAATATLLSDPALPGMIARLADAVHQQLHALPPGWTLRGAGALWVLEAPSADLARQLQYELFAHGICIGAFGKWVRLLPPAVVAHGEFAEACAIIAASAARLSRPR